MFLNSASFDLPVESKIIRYKYIFFVIAALIVGVLYPNTVIGQTHKVRIAILKDVSAVTLSIRGKYTIIDPKTNRELASGRRLQKSEVTLTPNGIMIADKIYFVDQLRILVKKDVSIYSKGNIDSNR